MNPTDYPFAGQVPLFEGVTPEPPRKTNPPSFKRKDPVWGAVHTWTPLQVQRHEDGLHPCGRELPARNDPAAALKCGKCMNRSLRYGKGPARCLASPSGAASKSSEVRAKWPACVEVNPDRQTWESSPNPRRRE